MRDETLGPGAWKFWLSISFAFVSFAALNSCGSRYESYAVEAATAYQLEEMKVGDGVWRLENKEVVCYQAGRSGGLQCLWKEDNRQLVLSGGDRFWEK